MTEINWINLPEHNWIQIFENLDGKSLLNVSETCLSFAELFAGSAKLNDKVRMVLDVSNDLATTLMVVEQSNRIYRNLKMKTRNRRYDWIQTNDAIKIGEIFGSSVVDLILGHETSIFDLETLLVAFDKLKSCSFVFGAGFGGKLYSDQEFFRLSNKQQKDDLLKTPNPSVNIERIEFDESLIACSHIFRNATNLKAIVIKNWTGFGWKPIENLLMKQKNLKELQFDDCGKIFNLNLMSKVPFQLEKFSLTNGILSSTESSTENTIDFFLSQRKLKSIELSLTEYEEEDWFNFVFKQMLPYCKSLKSISISTCLPREMDGFGSRRPIADDDTLITKIRACNDIFSPNVKELKYEKGREEKTNAFMQSFVEIFPNLKILCLDYCLNKEELRLISSFEHLESLSFGSKTSDLIEIQVTSKNLTTVKYRSRERPSEFLDDISQEKSSTNFDCLEDFIKRHPMIRHLSLDTPCLSKLSSFPIDGILVGHLPNLESFSDKFNLIDSE